MPCVFPLSGTSANNFQRLGRCYFPSLAVLLTAFDRYIMSFLGPLLGCQAGVPTIQAVVVRVLKVLVCN